MDEKGSTLPSMMWTHRRRCGHDGQRKRVAHMPTATTTAKESSMIQDPKLA
jgi:hypothetical protein